MSSQKEAYARSRVGAHGDRRQQPALTKTLSGIRSKMHILRKRPSTNPEVDEEEWNQRMQTWEKKRQRLSGSDWDRSFREAVRNRLKGKKPWRTPISSSKASLHKADRKSNSSENENNGRSDITELLRSDWENVASIDTDSWQKNDYQNTKRKGDGKIGEMCIEVVGLKRETSKMELDVTAAAHSGSSVQSVQSRPPNESTNLESLKGNVLKAIVKTSDTAEKADDIVLTRINSLILADSNNSTQSSTRFVKTVLSPIQSESDCSKIGAEVRSRDGQNMTEETTDITEETCNGNASVRVQEIRKEQSTDEKEMNSSKPNLRKKLSKAKHSFPSEQSVVKKSLDEYDMKVKCLNSDLSSQNNKTLHSNQESGKLPGVQNEIRELVNTNETKLKNDEEYSNSAIQKTNTSSQTTFQLSPTIDKTKASKEADEKSPQQLNQKFKDGKKHRNKKFDQKDPKKDIAGPRKVCSSDAHAHVKVSDEVNAFSAQYNQHASGVKGFNQKNNRTDSVAEEKTVNVDENAKLKHIESHEFRVTSSIGCIAPNSNSFERGMTGNKPSRSSKPLAREFHVLPVKSKHIPVSKIKGEDDRKTMEALCNSSSLAVIYPSKERTLHAIFSSPDTEIFGSRKKTPAQPVFIRTAFTEDDVPVDSQMVIVESRPQSDESLMMPDESVESLSTSPGSWYREFRHPVMSSEEFDADLMKSDCYREIIIDRSGCRSLYDGPCHATISKGYDKCRVRRFEVCHDTSKCFLKNAKKGKPEIHHVDNKSIYEASSVESWYNTD